MGLGARLRRLWRGHDEKLVERGLIGEELREEGAEQGSGLAPVNYATAPGGEPVPGYNTGESAADALRSEDELEHEEPR